MRGEIEKHNDAVYSVDVPNIGTGRMVTTSTYVVMILAMLESDKYSQVSVLSSVMRHLGIEPDDIVIEHEHSEGRRRDLNYQRRQYSWEKKK